MSIDEYAYLWDGSQPGWTLQRFNETTWRVTFHFAAGGPTKSELLHLRELLDEFRDLAISMLYTQLKGEDSFSLPREMGNIEHRALVNDARSRGLDTESNSIDRTSYLPLYSDETALIIEDDATALAVAERMIASGVPVTEVHSD